MARARRSGRARVGLASAVGSVVLATVVGVGWALAWKPAPRLAAPRVELLGEFRPYSEHGAARDGQSGAYVYRAERAAGPGSVLVFGSIHTNRADDPQIGLIEDAWDAEPPTLALTETTLGLHLGGKDSAVRRLGEFGVLAWLARRDGVPIASLEPAWEAEIGSVLERFDQREAAAFYFLRVFLSERGDAEADDRLAAHLLGKRASRSGLVGSFEDLAAFDTWWDAELAQALGPWRELPAEAVWPRDEGSLLSRVAFEANRARDKHFARLIVDAVGRGESVMVVCGASHALTLEPVLRASLGVGEEARE